MDKENGNKKGQSAEEEINTNQNEHGTVDTQPRYNRVEERLNWNVTNSGTWNYVDPNNLENHPWWHAVNGHIQEESSSEDEKKSE